LKIFNFNIDNLQIADNVSKNETRKGILMGWSKLYNTIVLSSIWSEDDHTRLLWITMLALADSKDCVWASVPGLAKAANIPLDSCLKAIKVLSEPDPYSRSKEFEGRRIKIIDGGWFILNRRKFIEQDYEDKRREYNRRYYHQVRKKKKEEEHQIK